MFRYAVATGRAQRDPSGDLRGAIPPAVERHHPTITEPKRVGELLRAIVGYSGSHVTRYALQLAPLVFVRPGELRKAEWSEFDLQGRVAHTGAQNENEGRSHRATVHTSPGHSHRTARADRLRPLCVPRCAYRSQAKRYRYYRFRTTAIANFTN